MRMVPCHFIMWQVEMDVYKCYNTYFRVIKQRIQDYLSFMLCLQGVL